MQQNSQGNLTFTCRSGDWQFSSTAAFGTVIRHVQKADRGLRADLNTGQCGFNEINRAIAA
jgi:hypothetical protein